MVLRTLISVELAKRVSRLCVQLGLQIGLLIGRDGSIVHVIVAGSERLYLPDLGRFRLEEGRLRRLRLIVFAPQEQCTLKPFPRSAVLFVRHQRHSLLQAERSALAADSDLDFRTTREEQAVLSPEIAADLLTDLEKLRLDAVAVIAVNSDAVIRGLSLGFLEPGAAVGIGKSGAQAFQKGGIAFLRAQDLYDLDLDFESFIRDLESSFRASRVRGFDTSKDHAVLVGAYTASAAEAQASMDELVELARTAGIQVLDCITQRRRALDPKTLIGKGKVEQLVLHCLDLDADLLVFDRELSAGQLRSISQLTELRVIDRSMLILDIFAQRARSSEGRLQVELAQLKYSLPRLTEKDTGLSRLTRRHRRARPRRNKT